MPRRGRRTAGPRPTGCNVAAGAAEIYRFADGKFVGSSCLTGVAGLTRQLIEERAAVPATA